MKVFGKYLLLVAAAVAKQVAADAFTTDEQALWIDRHNYFRMTALPWSAGDMLKMKWSDSLATSAATAAATCTSTTASGVNAYSAASGSASSKLIDLAFKEWAVTTSLSIFPTLTAPQADGDTVGTGVYDSYSQIIWSTTNEVGCGYATCSSAVAVVCQYSPAGNTAGTAWYTHATQGSMCPSGTVDSVGLCIVDGDSGYDDIAPIPSGSNAYDVYSDYIDNMQKALLGETVSSSDAGPATGGSDSVNPASTTAAPTSTTATPTPTSTSSSSTNETPTLTKASSDKEDNDADSSSNKKTTTTPSTTASSTGSSSSKKTTTSTTSDDDGESAPGTVQPSDNSGSTFTNAATSTTSTTSSATDGQTTSSATSAESSTTTTTTDATAATSTTTSETTASTPASASATSSTSATANTESSTESSSGVSATGIAGVIVVGVAAVAGFAIFTSYKKNQQRQRDIMVNGGIHVL